MKWLTSSCLCILLLLGSNPLVADIHIIDLEEREVRIAAHPERIALGFYYEDYLAVAGDGAIEQLVSLSRTPWANWRPRQWQRYTEHFPSLVELPDFGNTEDGTFSTETLIASRPDVAILASWQFHSLGSNLQQLEAAGIPVVVLDYNAQTLERHLQSTRVLGQLLGKQDRAESLAEHYQAQTLDTLARIQASEPTHKRIYVELAQKGPDEFGNSYGQGMWAGVIEMVGGHNIAAGQIGNWGPLSAEYIITQQPDIILLAGSEWLNQPHSVQMGFGANEADAQERLHAYTQRPGWASFPAVQNKSIYGIYHGGNRTLSDFVYARTIAKALYPEAFVDVNPVQELIEFYDRWMPIQAEGLFITRMQ